MPEIRKIAKIAILATAKKFNPNNRKFSFELLGFDFMIDENYKCWLLEVNKNPCMEESNDLLSRMLPRAIGILYILISKMIV